MAKRVSKAVAVISGDVKGVVYFEQDVSFSHKYFEG